MKFGPLVGAALQVQQGLIVYSEIDWSVSSVNNPVVYDFGTQPYAGKKLEFVRGIWCDNSGNTNDIIISVASTQQALRVYAGEVATLPIFATQLPVINMTNAENGTPNAGVTVLIFTSWDLGLSIAQTTGGSVVITKDSNLASTSGGYVRPAQFSNAPTIVNGVVASGAWVSLWGAGAPQGGWWVSNVNTSYAFTLVFSSTGQYGILVPPQQTIFSGQFGNSLLSHAAWAYGSTANPSAQQSGYF